MLAAQWRLPYEPPVLQLRARRLDQLLSVHAP
jgi:hypothetical protein